MSNSVTSDKLTSKQKSIFIQVFFTFFINGSLALILGAILPYMKESYSINYKIGGMLISFHAIGNLISSFLGGMLPSYIGRKKSILILSGFGCVAFLMITLTSNPYLLLLAFFFTGINRGAVSNFSNSMVNEIATGKAWALNLLHSIFAIGAFIAPFIALFSIRTNTDGWKLSCYILAFLCLIEFIIYFFMEIPERNKIDKKKTAMDWSFLKNRYFLTAAGILFSYLCAEQAVNGWLVTYFKESGLMKDSFAQSMASLLWVIILIGRLFNAYISQKVDKHKLLLVNVIGYVLFFVLLLSSRENLPIVIGIIGVGFFMSGLYPTTISSVGNIVKEYPMALSFLLTFAGLGSILMPTFIGLIAERAGIIAGMSTVIIAVVITFCFILYNFFIQKKPN